MSGDRIITIAARDAQSQHVRHAPGKVTELIEPARNTERDADTFH